MTTATPISGDIMDLVNSLTSRVAQLEQRITSPYFTVPAGSTPTFESVTIGEWSGINPAVDPNTLIPLAMNVSPPTALTLTPNTTLDDIGVDASWVGPVDGSAQSYIITIGRKQPDGTFTLWDSLSVSSTAAHISGLVPNAVYGFQVSAVNPIGVVSSPYPPASWQEVTTAPDATIPSTVTGLTATAGATSIMLTWNENTEVDVANGNGFYEVEWADNAALTGSTRTRTNATLASFVGLDPTKTYSFRVRAYDASANPSPWTGLVSLQPGTVGGAAAASDGSPPASSPTPTLKAGVGPVILVQFPLITNADPTTYEVHISTVNGFTPDGTTKAVESPASNITLFRDGAGNPLTYDTTYYVKVVAKDADGAAAASAQASVVTTKLGSGSFIPGSIDTSDLTSTVQNSITTAQSTADSASTAAATAQSAANAAQTTANGRNRVYYQTSAPTGATVNDLWFDTDNDYALAQWNGSAWVGFGLGSAAISYLDAGKITVGYLSAARIQASSITADKLTIGSVSSTLVRNGTFEDVDVNGWAVGWTKSLEVAGGGDSSYSMVATTPIAGDRSAHLTNPNGNTGGSIMSDAFPVQENDLLAVRAMLRTSVAGTSAFYVRVVFGTASDMDRYTHVVTTTAQTMSSKITDTVTGAFSVNTASDVVGYTDLISGMALATTNPHEVTGQIKVPVGAKWCRIALYAWSAGAAYTGSFDQTSASRVVISAQIANGAISTPQLAAGAITAASGIIASLDASKITTGTMNASYITAGTLTSDRINATVGLDATLIKFNTMSGDRITAHTLDINSIKTSTLSATTLTLASDGQIVGGSDPMGPSPTGFVLNGGSFSAYYGGSVKFRVNFTNGTASFAGDISGSSGTFSGTLSGGTVSGGLVTGTTITGSTITGGTIQTVSGLTPGGSAIGVLLGASNTDRIQLFSGVSTETDPATISANPIFFSSTPSLVMRSPIISGNSAALTYIALASGSVNIQSAGLFSTGGSINIGNSGSSVTMHGSTFTIGETTGTNTINGGTTFNQNLAVNGTIFIGAGGVAGGGKTVSNIVLTSSTITTPTINSGGSWTGGPTISGATLNSSPSIVTPSISSGGTWTGGPTIQNATLNNSPIIVTPTIQTGGSWGGGPSITGSPTIGDPAISNFATQASGTANVIMGTGGKFTRITSSMRYKQDISDVQLADAMKVLDMREVWFRGIEEVNKNPDARYSWGFLAEEVHGLGLTPLVMYEADTVESVAYDRLPVAHNLILKHHHSRIASLESFAAEDIMALRALQERVTKLETATTKKK